MKIRQTCHESSTLALFLLAPRLLYYRHIFECSKVIQTVLLWNICKGSVALNALYFNCSYSGSYVRNWGKDKAVARSELWLQQSSLLFFQRHGIAGGIRHCCSWTSFMDGSLSAQNIDSFLLQPQSLPLDQTAVKETSLITVIKQLFHFDCFFVTDTSWGVCGQDSSVM